MLKIALYLCCAIILVSGTESSSGQAVEHPLPSLEAVDSSVHVSTPPEPPASSTTSPNHTSTTEKPTTTTPPSTTTAPTTTTSKTTTTTAPPKTTTPPPKTTTPTPTTTTPAPPTTTPVPVPTTPAPAPKDGQWVVNGNNETCIVIQMAVQFNVSYTTKDNKTAHKVLTLPNDNTTTVVTGTCGATEQLVNIAWHAGNDSLNIHFVKNDTTKRYSMHHVELNLGSHEFPDGDSNKTLTFVHEADQFPTSLSNSYRCMRLQKLELTRNGTNGTLGSIEISDLQFQAFKSDKSSTFGAAQDCSADVPDVVPIAVGCALTALVIIILAAYLVGRRRSQARGYLSM